MPSSSSLNIKSQLIKAQFNTPLFSPRTTYNNHIHQINSLKINMIINIDKYILGNLKNQFEKRARQINQLQFIYFTKKYLKDWNLQLYGRQVKMEQCLIQIWKEIDIQNKGKITWQQFNTKIIQTSLNLKSLSNNAGIQAPTFKQFNVPINPTKYQNPVAKLIYIKGKNKMAFFRQQSIQIQFFTTQYNSQQSIPQTKPLILPQQQLKVQTIMKVKQKNQSKNNSTINTHDKSHKYNHHKTIKKDLKVSSYKNTIIDAIYLQDQKYDMLIVSCSDKYIRGYNVSNILPTLAIQLQNEDQLMVHQFPVQIYNMAWDSVNQVLYATGKHPKIYQWMIKMDSQRQMYDIKGHDNMISSLLMMPKLQLLATGGYDGKLILWDTVGQTIKCKYEQHTRAISGITFHQGLILLFTSSFDHKICIWNPYIASLIHKIDNSLNVISLQIIPNTNYLLSLDCGGTVKIRQINRFTQIGSFSIFRSQSAQDTQNYNKQEKGDKQLSISMCSKKDGLIQYYFGTQKIIGYDYFEIQKNSIIGGTISEMRYDSSGFKLYTPLKNHVLVWNLLIGKIEQVFYDMTDNDITSLQISQQLGYFICGDVDGNIIQRKLSNGYFIKYLTKLKSSIHKLKLYQLQRNQKQKSLTKTYLLFSTTQQGQISVMKSHPKSQFVIYKQFSLKNDLNIHNTNIVSFQYFGTKNILIIKLSTNQILFVDVQKKSLLIKIQFGQIIIKGMNLISNKDNIYLMVLNSIGQLSGFYLPPHTKKFKPACYIQMEGIQKVQLLLFGNRSGLYFVSTQQNEIYCMRINRKILQIDNNRSYINNIWRTRLQKRILSMILIQNDQILLILTQNEDFTFISVQSGQIICRLRQQLNKTESVNINQQNNISNNNKTNLSNNNKQKINSSMINNNNNIKSLNNIKSQNNNNLSQIQQIQPILYFKQKTNQIYIPNQQQILKLDQQQLQSTLYQRIINPNFFIQYLINKNIKNFNKSSNPSYQLYLNFNTFIQNKIKHIKQIKNKINQYQNIFQKKGPTQVQKKIQKALQLQKKWDKQKQSENNNNNNLNNIKSINNLNNNISNTINNNTSNNKINTQQIINIRNEQKRSTSQLNKLNNNYNNQNISNSNNNKNKLTKYSRNSSLNILHKYKQFNKKTQHSSDKLYIPKLSKQNNSQLIINKNKNKFNQLNNIDLIQIKNDPLYRLGLALQSLNHKDKKASHFIELAQLKQSLKLPKINTLKINTINK